MATHSNTSAHKPKPQTPPFEVANFEVLLEGQRAASEILVCSCQRTLQSLAEILSIQVSLTRSLYQQWSKSVPKLVQPRDGSDPSGELTKVAQSMAETTITSAQRVVGTMCDCCANIASDFSDRMKAVGTTGRAATTRLAEGVA